MFDFSNIMSSLGFEAEPIINAFSVCHAMIEEVRDFALKLGDEYDADALCFDFDGNYSDDAFAEAVRTRFLDSLWRYKSGDDSLTPLIVINCYKTTFEILENTKLFEALDARFFGEMPFLFQCGDGTIHNLGDIENLDGEACAEKICAALDRAVVDKIYEAIVKDVYSDCEKEWVEIDLYGGAYDGEDVLKCLRSGKVEGSVARTVSLRADIEQPKKHSTAERE